MGFIYYIPRVKGRPAETDMALAGMAGLSVGMCTTTQVGCDGIGGVVFTVTEKSNGNENTIHNLSLQSWTKIPDLELWVGYNLYDKPKPKDFLRKDYLNGDKLNLGDDNEWIIPMARKFEEGCILPKAISMMREGEITQVLISKYLPLQKIAEKLKCFYPWEMEEAERNKVWEEMSDWKSIFKICLEIIRFNYNISNYEASILGIFTDKNAINILQSVVDLKTYIEYAEKEVKKKLEAPDMNSGQKD